MVVELKPIGKPTTLRKTISFGQNQGLVWFSNSNLKGNQLLKENLSFGQNQRLA